VLFPESSGLKDFEKLPPKAKAFIEEIESELSTPVVYIGTGPDAEDIIHRKVSSRVW